MKHKIQYKKWLKEDITKLYKSARELLLLRESQLYIPIMSLYFYIHNTPNSHRILDFKRNNYIYNILSVNQIKDYNSNILLNAIVFSNKKKVEKELFGKVIPLLDPIHYLLNNYNTGIHRNCILPSNYSFNTTSKINDMNNMAYIDIFFSYIVSEITIKDKNPSFPIYYGSLNGIMKKYNLDITEDYHDFKEEAWFHKNLGDQFKMDIYMDSDSEDENDYISVVKNIPCQLFFIEKLDGLLSELLINNFNDKIILSCLFQVSYGLAYLQKHFKFTHNDLHIDNIMYQRTDKTYLYYKFNNIYYKVPTYGYIFKIIDFGRAIFTFKNKLFFSDCFSKYGDADGQYKYPVDTFQYKKKSEDYCDIKPNYHFDLCRLSMTILEEINEGQYSDKFIDFLKGICLNNDGGSFCNMADDFRLYISIAKYACNALPREIIKNEIFNEYRIKKKLFPRKSFYTV